MRYINKIIYYYQRLDFINLVKILFIEFFVKFFSNLGFKYSFSHTGEDLHIISLLKNKNKGFYIDVGSNHPIQNSNTYKLYLLGWTGILVDGNKELISKSRKVRKKDICINAIVSNMDVDNIDFYISQNSNYSSINLNHITSNNTLVSTLNLPVLSLNKIIQNNLTKNFNIDILSIDVEGHDYEVLLSIDLELYKPKLIIIEDLEYDIKTISSNRFSIYLKKFGYQLISIDQLNLYFLLIQNFNTPRNSNFNIT